MTYMNLPQVREVIGVLSGNRYSTQCRPDGVIPTPHKTENFIWNAFLPAAAAFLRDPSSCLYTACICAYFRRGVNSDALRGEV